MPDPDHIRIFLVGMFVLFFAGWGFYYLRPRTPRIGGRVEEKGYAILGAFPRSPRPLTVDMTPPAAKLKFIYGLNQLQANYAWKIQDPSQESRSIFATLSWSEKAMDRSDFTLGGQTYHDVTLHTVLTLTGEFIPQGTQKTLVQWSYSHDTTSDQMPGHHYTDPHIDAFCSKTNYSILRSLGLAN